MNSRQAKDFFVQQVAEQAALEGLPLSDIEKRMMYFTESDSSSCEDPRALNNEFEMQCDTGEYEAKMSGLLRRAYGRLRGSQAEDSWGEAVSELRKGDHYLLVLLDERPHASALFKAAWSGLLAMAGIQRRSS
ncbi:MAG TPA: hypothetical protein VGG80_10515 [Acidobacteriaceae bacterium]|jgi:hypothetical protein